MTFEDLMNVAVEPFLGKYDIQEGSFLYSLLSPAIYAIWEFYDRLDDVGNMVHPGAESGEYLDADALQYGITRKSGTCAEVTLLIKGEAGTVVPVGSIFSDQKGINFSTENQVAIGTNGSVLVSATCLEAGVIGNVPANTVIYFNNEISGIDSVTNPEESSGGTDEETDAALYERLSTFKKRPASSGNAYSYEQWAISIDGVGAAKVYPLENGAGTVGIVIGGPDKMPVSEKVITDVQEYIDSQKPIGVISATVRSVKTNDLPIKATVTLAQGTNIEVVKNAFITLINDYFTSVAMTDELIKYTTVGAMLLDVTGVVDYADLLINGVPYNVQMPKGYRPTLGEVELNVSDR